MDEQKTTAVPLTLFYAYARTDEKLRQKLEKHLSVLSQQGLITTWHDRQILPGSNWKQTLDDHLNTASVILLLISPDFIASDYCFSIEMEWALARHEEGSAYVIPILLRPVDWESAPFSSLQVLPSNAKPVTEWHNQDAPFVDITKGIRRVLETFSLIFSSMHDPAQHNLIAPSSLRDQHWNLSKRDAIARLKYLKHLEKRYAFITLPLGPVEGFSLQAVFQPLALRRDPVTAENHLHEGRRHLLGEPIPSDNEPRVLAENGEEALAKSPQNRIIVLGGPGTGKTTLLQSIINERIQRSLTDLTTPIPIFLSLPDLARSSKPLPEYLALLMKEAGLSEHPTNLLWKTIEEGWAFVCLDSLDEVTPSQRPEMIRLINELAARSGNTWVVGSRFTEYKGGQFKRGQFAEWELLPLDHQMREKLALRLLPELHHLLAGIDTSGVPEPAKFVQSLEYHPRASAWGENPLLYSLAATVFVRTGTLPTSLAALYQQVIDAVVQLREPDFTRQKMLLRTLAGLALELYQIKGRTFTRDDIVAFLPLIRQRQQENWLTEEMVNRIVVSGLLDEVAQETYGFRHQTFQEYLAAVELAQRLVSQHQDTREEGWSLAWSKRTYSRWTKILRLLVGVVIQKHGRKGAQLVHRWLLALVRQQAEAEGDIGNLGLTLALESLTEVSGTKAASWKEVYGEEVETKVIRSWISALFAVEGPKHQIQQQRLLGLAQLVSQLNEPAMKLAVEQLSVKLATYDRRVRQMALLALERLGYKSLPLELLLSLFQDTDREVRSTAVHLLGNLEDHISLNVLLSALSNEDHSFRGVAQAALEKRSDRAAVSRLLQEVLHSEDWRARASAAQVLARLGMHVPVEPFLADLHESNWERRWEAIHVLAQLGADTPIEPLLTALGDEENNVRTAAAYALGALKAFVPVERLIDALNDNNRDIRIAALEALGRREDKAWIVFGPLGTITSNATNTDPSDEGEGTNIPEERDTQALVEPLLKMLQDTDQFVRSKAAEVLEKLGDHVPVEPLVAALADESEFVRPYITRALGNIRRGVPVEPLLKALCDEDENMRQAAAETLVKMGVRPSEEFLLEDVKHQLTWVRATALQVLWSMREHVPIEVFEELLNDEDAEVRANAAEALGQFGDSARLEPLLIALQDEDVRVQMAAAKALGKFSDRVPLEPLLEALNDERLQVREEVARTLGELGEHVPVEPFLEALGDEWAVVRAAAADVLGELGTRTPLAPLLSALSDPDPSVRSMVVWALGEQGEHTPIETLVTVLKDEDATVRSWVVWTLGKLGDRTSIESLLAALQDESDEVRPAVVWYLREMIEYVPLEPLLTLIHHGNRKIRKAAWQVLEGQNKSLPVEGLIHALNDADREVRIAAIKAIGRLDEPVIAEYLLSFLKGKDWEIIFAARSALSKLVESLPVELLLEALRSKESNVRADVVELLGQLKGPAVVDALLTLTHDESLHVRARALIALGDLGILSSIEELSFMLEKGQQPERCEAARALGELGDRGPLEALLAALYDEDGTVRGTAVEALGKLGRCVPFEPLVAAVGDSKPYVRQAAIKVLRQAHPEALLAVVPEAVAVLQGGEPGKILGSMIQGVIADTIGNTGTSSPLLFDKLTQLLEESYWEVRMKAAQALSKLRRNIPDRAIRRMLELRQDPQSQSVRIAVSNALTEILSLETGIEDG